MNTNGWQYEDNGKYRLAIQQMQANDLILSNTMAGYVKNRELRHCSADNGFDMADQHEDILLVVYSSAFQAFGISYTYTTELALLRQTISGARAWNRDALCNEQSPADVPLFYDLVGHWHGGLVYEEKRSRFVMLNDHAVSVSRERADELHHILFTIPTPAMQ